MAKTSKKSGVKAADKKADTKADKKAAAARAHIASAVQALENAAAAARDAKRVAKTLSNDKAAKKLRSLGDEAKQIASISKKNIERRPKKTEKQAAHVTARIEKAIATATPVVKQAAKPTAKAEPAALPAPVVSTPDFSALTVAQLRQRARDAGHSGYSRFTKAQLVSLLSS